MARIGRPPSCLCGECRNCKRRAARREAWQALPLEERREIIARRDRDKARAADRARYYRHRDSRLARMREWYEENKERTAEHKRRWVERNPEKRAAHIIAGNAIRDGLIVRTPCEVCGSKKADAHHPDYPQPLNVMFLCREHHMELHRRYDEGQAA